MAVKKAGFGEAELRGNIESACPSARRRAGSLGFAAGVASWLLLMLCMGTAGAADVIKGAQTYARHCAACHGPNGSSVMPSAPQLIRGERLMQSDMVLLGSLRAGRNSMPAYLGILSDAEILDVIAYSRTLRR